MYQTKTVEYATLHQLCPVCQGRGRVHLGFYSYTHIPGAHGTEPPTEQCRRCEGLGTIERSSVKNRHPKSKGKPPSKGK